MVNASSLIPPRTLAKIERLTDGERREYVQGLIGSYEERQGKLKRVGRKLAADWVEGQAAHLEGVLVELREWRDKR
jgi:hypothetical protein